MTNAAPVRERKRKPGEKQRIAALLENVARGGCPCGGKFKWTGVQMRCDKCDAHEGWPMKESLRHLLRGAAAELKA